MAKKRRTPPTPKMPDKVEHYYRSYREDTTDGLEAILAESRKTAKRAFNKHHLGSLDLLEPATFLRFNTFFIIIMVLRALDTSA